MGLHCHLTYPWLVLALAGGSVTFFGKLVYELGCCPTISKEQIELLRV